jgi:hypothetical protein
MSLTQLSRPIQFAIANIPSLLFPGNSDRIDATAGRNPAAQDARGPNTLRGAPAPASGTFAARSALKPDDRCFPQGFP